MTTAPNVRVIPAKPQTTENRDKYHQLRAASAFSYPVPGILLHPYFVLLSARLGSGFTEDVAGYIKIKRNTR